MNIQLKSFPANNGDSFLISYGIDNKKHLLIDGGYTDTYKKYLGKDLLQIASNGECLEKLIVTHIDCDHIQGIISLLKKNNQNKIIEIKEVWHNSFRHLDKQDFTEDSKVNEYLLRRIIQRGYVKHDEKYGEIEISAEQGTTLGALLLEGNYSWNKDFEKKAICIENRKCIELGGNSRIYLLSPTKEKLNKLKGLWMSELRKFGVNYNYGDSNLYDDAFEMLVSWEKNSIKKGEKKISAEYKNVEELLKESFEEDDSITNGSSIAFILEIDDKKMLFLADAHPSLITHSLYEYQPEGKVFFDLIKVSHHGCKNNISKDLLSKIDSDKYLFSTNGNKHHHPDKVTIANIIGRDTEVKRNLYFNYQTENSDFFNRKDWFEKYDFSINYLAQESPIISI